MNRMDLRVIVASALTAAVVSVTTTMVIVTLRARECPPAPAVFTREIPTQVSLPVAEEYDFSGEADEVDEIDEIDDSFADEPVDPEVFGPANCDAEAAKEKGLQNINMGQHAAALAQFEASLRCKNDPYVRTLAFMESCASGNSAKAKHYYKRLTPAQQTKFAQICIRQKPPVAYE